MDFKANRLYYALSKKFKNMFLLRSAGYAALLLLWIMINGIDELDIVIILGVFLLISFIVDIFLRPNKFEIIGDAVHLKLFIRIPAGAIRAKGQKYQTKRVNAKILNIDVIQYHASPFEESNRVGRIIIHGRVVARDFCEDYVEAEHLPSYVDIYGVKDFESAVSALKIAFPDATLQEL